MLQVRSSVVKNFIMVSVLAWAQSISGRTDIKRKVVLWNLDKIEPGMIPHSGLATCGRWAVCSNDRCLYTLFDPYCYAKAL